MTIATLGLALLSGMLSTLSPCVLPLLPIVLGTAAAQHRLGPLALATGLAASFVAIGLLIATVGFSVGLDGAMVRKAAAAIMVAIGVVLLLPQMQDRLAVAAGPAAGWASGRLGTLDQSGLKGQLLVGVLLGAVWSPCAGPTLGAASLLAAQGKDLAQVALTMLAFGLGAALPLLVLGLLSREAMLRLRGRMMSAGRSMKAALGGVLVTIGFAVISGLDKVVEARLVDLSPAWLTDLTTRF